MMEPFAIRTRMGSRHTRLLPRIHFDPVMLAAPDPTRRCVLGWPPVSLCHLHWPALVDACFARIEEAIRHPVQVEEEKDESGDWLRLNILGVLVMERDHEGVWSCWQWENADAGCLPTLKGVPGREVVAVGLPYRDLWARRFYQGIYLALRAQFAGRGVEDGPRVLWVYTRWLVDGVVDRLWTEQQAFHARAAIARALDLHPAALHRAACQDGLRGGKTPLRMDSYNRQAWRASHLTRIREQTPQFLPLLEQLWHTLPAHGDPLRNLKGRLKSRGLGGGLWPLLHQRGTAWMRLLRHYYSIESRLSGDAAIDLLRLVSLFGNRQLPPVWMLAAVINEVGNPHAPKKGYARYWSHPHRRPLLHRLGRWHAWLHERGDVAMLARLREQLHVLLHWAHEHPDKVKSAWMTRVGLKRFLGLVHEWNEELLLRARDDVGWTPVLKLAHMNTGSWQVVELNSMLAILQEGRAMRHCAEIFTQQCRAGDYVLLSIRDHGTGKRVATVGLRRDGKALELDQVAGFANAWVTPEIHELAQRCTQPAPQKPTVHRRLARRKSIKAPGAHKKETRHE